MNNKYHEDLAEFLDMVSDEIGTLEEVPENLTLNDSPHEQQFLPDEYSSTDNLDFIRDKASARYIQCLLKAREKADIPQIIFDTSLKIRWRNTAYRRFRETPGLLYDYKNRTFEDFFTTFSAGNEECSKERQKLFASLKDPSGGYSWQGPVEGTGPNLKLIKARLSISPILFDKTDPEAPPLLYIAVLDDFSSMYKELLHSSFLSILKASLLKDEDTGNHIQRVNIFSRLLAEALMQRKSLGDVRWIDIDQNFIDDIGVLAAFHDVGKIGTSESILQKNGKLNKQEWEVMKEHTTNGALIMASYPNPMAQEIARSHHEKWDGSGYPFGLSNTEIPLAGRIVAVADVYDALRTKRPYKEAYTEEETFRNIKEGAGSHFDPGIVEVFEEIREEFNQAFQELAD